MSEPVLSIRNLTKRFGGLTAVNERELGHLSGRGRGAARRQRRRQVDADQVHLRRLPGRRGRDLLRGRAEPASPGRSTRGSEGIETIYQDLALANNLDVGANIFLGREMKKRYLGGLINTLDEKTDAARSRRRRSTRSRSISRTSPQPIESLSGGQRQAVAIARAVYWDAQADDHGRADQQSRRPRAAQGAGADPQAARPGRAGHPDHPHAARRLRRLRPARWSCTAGAR